MTHLVVFVCEHGAAKSPIAAAWLNRLADEAGVPLRAIARGTDPEPELSPAALAGMEADGIAAETEAPQLLDPDELRTAWRIVSFGPDLTDIAPAETILERWSVPAVSDGYDAARDAIVGRLTGVIDAAKTTARGDEMFGSLTMVESVDEGTTPTGGRGRRVLGHTAP